MHPTRIRWLGRQDYESIYTAMRDFTSSRAVDTPDEIWIVEHEPVYTLGQAADPSHVLAPGNIPLIQTDRGGQVTYHGPGQLVIYPLLDLKRRQIGPRALVFGIEQVLLDYLAHKDIQAERRKGAPGLYVAAAKIASIGLRVRKNGCYHGLSLNLDMDLAPFLQINPCGYAKLPMTQVADFTVPPALDIAGREIGEKLDTLLHSAQIHPLMDRVQNSTES